MTGVVTVEDFNSVRWHVAQRTYGNNHSTLIAFLCASNPTHVILFVIDRLLSYAALALTRVIVVL